jgi:hypothetical protein
MVLKMPDAFGVSQIPIPVPTNPGTGETEEALSDPALDALGGYFTSVLRAKGAAAWAACAPDEPIVRTLLKHDPQEGEFNANDLPALYVWRESIQRVRQADDLTTEQTVFQILWVMPPTQQSRHIKRDSFFAGWSHIIALYAKRERDPSWISPGDPDPTAAKRGSVLRRIACLFNFQMIGTNRTRLNIEVVGRGEMSYRAFQARFDGQELINESGLTDGRAGGGLDLKLLTPDQGTEAPPARVTEHAIVDPPFAAEISGRASVAANLTVV